MLALNSNDYSSISQKLYSVPSKSLLQALLTQAEWKGR